MHPLDALSIVVFTIGAYAFTAALVLDLARRRRPETGPAVPAPMGATSGAGTALTAVSAVWFVVNLLSVVLPLAGWPLSRALAGIVVALSFLYPPLIAHTFVVETLPAAGGPSARPWRAAVALLYAVALGVATITLGHLHGMRGLDLPLPGGPGPWMAMLFILSGGLSWLAVSRRSEPASPPSASDASTRRGFAWMLVVLIGVFALLLAGMLGLMPLRRGIELAARSLPLAFLVVGAWFESRFDFYDVLVKRGLFLACTLVVLVVWAGWLLPLVAGAPAEVGAWLAALGLLPIAMVLPALRRALGRWLDHVWLGRDRPAVDAVKRFVSALQGTATEQELVTEAERELGEIFRAKVAIDLDAGVPAAGGDARLVLPVRMESGRSGVVCFGRRRREQPFFSEDVALARSLIDVFGFLLENARLQARRQEQDRRTRELSLAASRSELKALRAQVNPHFLFNALNAIAGLIPSDPVLADRTVERLAEVFRYTLRISESEWARLGDEMAFVRACLDIEQARFGPRLAVDVAVEAAVADCRVPTLMVHTIVENAVKHGVAAVPGAARIDVRAEAVAGSLRVFVADSGPGFDAGRPPRQDERGLGYGLRNVRERLRGYFGDRAGLTWSRDEARGLTLVELTMPLEPEGES